eukprot:1468421-Ditylum_brightwellii.AAC.1
MDLLIQATICQEEIIPEEADIKETVGKYNVIMWPRTYAMNHLAAPLLYNYAEKGCSVDCGPDWSHHHILTALKHRPHKSARTLATCKTLHTETKEKMKNGFA